MRPPTRPISSLLAALSVVCLIVLACGERKPRYTLQQVMVEIDYRDKALMKQLADPTAALINARKIEEWMRDPSVERHLSKKVRAEDRALFGDFRRDFDLHLAAVIQSAEARDVPGIHTAYARMHMRCELCHKKFRPGL